MLRRLTALVTALIATTAFSATAASADTDDFEYSPDEYALSISITTPVVGEPFVVNLSGPVGNPSFTLEIPGVDDSAIDVAGAQTAATTDGSAAFVVTLPSEGTYTLTATDAEGQVVATSTVGAVVDDAAVGDDAGDADGVAGADGTTTTAGGLAVTGATSTPYLLAAGLLLVVGLGALLVARGRGRAARAAEPSHGGDSSV
ncbi:hypothetical protein LEP48_06515 [Isoptericola sp. NEAU-Y5]|uniref:LPXTG-motif cell wall anchor domain protein n=1 Tax=Isoptericola luteus TaxID=2879484 RepID=A0ABS7ZEX1_9MICO|nr:hypothetical protein [Isoptericola sp. NEAU-Y5]MCA5893007.1 hypothetical protein [Isoptericola sp. NEAU-Y5]